MASKRWSPEEAQEWYAARPTPRGTNFHPSTAANWTEMWQASTFDEATIARELELGAGIGLNSIRMFLPFVVWEHDPDGLKSRIERVLELAAASGMTAMFCLFDDVHVPGLEPHLGPQKVIPGKFVSAWTASPGVALVSDPERWPVLRDYVTDVVGSFRSDERVLVWDLYNEPGVVNTGVRDRSLELLRATFEWAREARPAQPLSSGVWIEPGDPFFARLAERDPGFAEWLPLLNETMLELSDVVTFHSYLDIAGTQDRIERLGEQSRPMMCTEWMARELGVLLETHLPVFAASDPPVGWYMWGLVTGRMQTHINPLKKPEDHPYARPWRHDLFWPDGTPYDEDEIAQLRAAAGWPAATGAA